MPDILTPVPLVPTPTQRKRIISANLNAIAADHPEYLSGIYTLICYPLMKWAVNTSNDIYPLPFEQDNNSLRLYRRILAYVDSSVYSLKTSPMDIKRLYNTFCYAHDIGKYSPNITLYYLREMYPKAADNYLSLHHEELSNLGEELDEIAMITDPAVAAEHVEDLYRMFRNDPNESKLYDPVVEALQDYPKDGPDAYYSLNLWRSGKSIDDIMAESGLAWNTLRRYRMVGAHAIEILKGCGIKVMIQMLRDEESKSWNR